MHYLRFVLASAALVIGCTTLFLITTTYGSYNLWLWGPIAAAGILASAYLQRQLVLPPVALSLEALVLAVVAALSLTSAQADLRVILVLAWMGVVAGPLLLVWSQRRNRHDTPAHLPARP